MVNSLTKPVMRLKGILIAGDTFTMLLVVWIGRLSHATNIWDPIGLISTALPFLTGWFIVTPLVGLFQNQTSHTWSKTWPRLLIGWSLIGLPIGLILRSISLGRHPIMGIIPSFAVVMFITTTLAMLGWRRGYVWWSQQTH